MPGTNRTIQWYVDGVLKGTQSTANLVPSGDSGTSMYLVQSITKSGILTVGDGVAYVMNIMIWQGN